MSQTPSPRNGGSRPAGGSSEGHTTSPAEIVATAAVDVTGPLLRARDVADWLAVAPGTILDWYERGQLPGFKVGGAVRFSRAELAEWLAAQHREAVELPRGGRVKGTA
jgi:excisionase family DNA binding protein